MIKIPRNMPPVWMIHAFMGCVKDPPERFEGFYEPKTGYFALIARYPNGKVVLRKRRRGRN